MDASLRDRAEELASEIAGQAETAEDLNNVLRGVRSAYGVSFWCLRPLFFDIRIDG